MLLQSLPGAGLEASRNQTDLFPASHDISSCGLWLSFNSLFHVHSIPFLCFSGRLEGKAGGVRLFGLYPLVSIRQLFDRFFREKALAKFRKDDAGSLASFLFSLFEGVLSCGLPPS